MKIFDKAFAEDGERSPVAEALLPDNSLNYPQGYSYDYERPYEDPLAKDIDRKQQNQILHDVTSAIGAMQNGLKWNLETAHKLKYKKGVIVQHSGASYQCLVDDTEQEPPHADWTVITTPDVFSKPIKWQPLLVKESPTSIKIPQGLVASVGSAVAIVDAPITLSLDSDLDTGSKVAGTDYYVYLLGSSTAFISATEQSYLNGGRLIGGFHYGLTGHSEAKTGNKTEDDMLKLRGINSHTFWDLTWRANKHTNRGLTFDGINWIDIYLADEEYAVRGWSKAGGWIAGGTTVNGRKFPIIPEMFGGNGSATYGKLTPFVAWDMLNAAGMEPINYNQFSHAMYGVEEGLPALGIETVVGKIEHYPRLTSRYGVEQATGVQWVWGADFGSSSLGSYKDIADSHGQVYSDVIVSLYGADRDNAVGQPGSRASLWYRGLTDSHWYHGVRGLRDHLTLD